MLKTRAGDIIGNLPETFLRMRDVQRVTGLGRSTIYRLIEQKHFPKPINLLGPRSVAWLESEVRAWQKAKIAESRGGADANAS